MNDKELVLEMFNKMNEEFKKEHETQVRNMLNYFECLSLHKDDLIRSAKDNYNDDPNVLSYLIEHINSLDENDLQIIANEILSEPIMDSFWYAIENYLDRTIEKIKLTA
ncbi:MAG: hypothetical protein LBN27_07265 [Prevotellaceae bacterium]|nr:hypothetical protein [Prevotellaceae bacterium]